MHVLLACQAMFFAFYLVGSLLSSMQNVVRTNEGDITETMHNLRTTSENVRALSESLKQRPWNLIRTMQPGDRRVPK